MNIMTIIIALIVFGVIVTVHEAGHFLMAKFCLVTVHEFAVGMGPKLISKRWGDTEYTIRLLPLGGFVRMEGEDQNSDDPNGFNHKSPLQRMSIIFAGPFMNFVLTIVLFSMLFAFVGVPSNTIGSLVEGMPAESSGLMKEDRIVKVDGQPVKTPEQVTRAISSSTNQSIVIDVLRNGQSESFEIQPVEVDGRRMVGIIYANEKSPGLAIFYGVKQTYILGKQMLAFLGRLFTGQMGMVGVSGPVGIISEVGRAAEHGLMSVIGLAALISLNLGLFNLLPIPALDGSRILFQFVELIRGKKIDPNKEGYIHMAGMLLLISLMVFVTYKDILKLLV